MKTRLYTTIILLLATIVVCFALPKPRYQSPDIIGTLDIPHAMRGWRSKDVSAQLDLGQDDRYAFVSDVFAREYRTDYGEKLLFLVLDAGNFHHPKVCFGSFGYRISELDDVELSSNGRTFKASALFAQKDIGGTVIVYWMVINKEQVSWSKQKFQQLWYQLFNKEKIGVMGRMDIPIGSDNTQFALNLAQKFIRDVGLRIPEDDAGYMFGESF